MPELINKDALIVIFKPIIKALFDKLIPDHRDDRTV